MFRRTLFSKYACQAIIDQRTPTLPWLSATRGQPSPLPNLVDPDLRPHREKHRTRKYSSVALSCFELRCVGQHLLECSFWPRPFLSVPLPPLSVTAAEGVRRQRRSSWLSLRVDTRHRPSRFFARTATTEKKLGALLLLLSHMT